MKNKTKNNLIFGIELSIYSILFFVFFALNFVDLSSTSRTVIYISFMTLSFGWLFLNSLVFKSLDNVVHTKMFKKDYLPVSENLTKKDYKRQGLLYVIILWIVYLLCIAIVKVLRYLNLQLFLMGACVMFILNTTFTHKCCLLSMLFLKNKNNCCKYCGINGWDYMIFASALIFAPKVSLLATIINIVIILISLIFFIIWECKYRKYPERFYPETNANIGCRNCLKQCKFKK